MASIVLYYKMGQGEKQMYPYHLGTQLKLAKEISEEKAKNWGLTWMELYQDGKLISLFHEGKWTDKESQDN